MEAASKKMDNFQTTKDAANWLFSQSCTFVAGSSKLDSLPGMTLPEVAFVGRSNVGKSSLINMLTNHKNLAKTSSKPGKTQLINHFKINNNWFSGVYQFCSNFVSVFFHFFYFFNSFCIYM